jgi:probable F420-dependent oxidoreductase
MDLGVSLPTSGPLATPTAIRRVAQEAERIGYATLWTYERLLRPLAPVPQPGGGPPQPVPEVYRLVYEPLETLSYVAALTERIRLGTSVIDALFHPPVVLARRFATLDQLSGGRAVAGLGQGWMPQEFATVNVPMRRRGAGLDELVAAMRAAWGADPVSYQGRFYRIAPSEVNPKPVQERLPVLIGANSPEGIKRAARIADGLNPIAFSAESLRGMVRGFRDAAAAAGRDPDTLTVAVRANVPMTSKPIDDGRPYLGGSPQQIAEDIAALSDLRLDEVMFANTATQDLDEHLHVLADLHATVTGAGG